MKYSTYTYITTTLNATFMCPSFTGKEKDVETGYGYFGARYMDHELLTGWLSVDPMSDKYPSLSPYSYCARNPVKLVDPDGRDTFDLNLTYGRIVQQPAEGNHCIRFRKDGKVLNDRTVTDIATRISSDNIMWNNNEGSVCYTYYLNFEDAELGKEVFDVITNECANSCSAKEWDYHYFLSSGGELSSSTSEKAIGHGIHRYTRENVKSWHHFHPMNSSESWFPSYSDQKKSQTLGVPCYLYSQGASWRFDEVVRVHTLSPSEYKKKVPVY